MPNALVKSVSDALAPLFRPAGNLIEGVNPGSWASPQNPIRPTIQLGVGIRQWDFTPGINLQFTPRGDVAIKFPMLWNISNSFDLCRLMIEHRKNQIAQRQWSVRVKPIPGETKKARLAREGSNETVKRLTALMKKPDGVHPFPIWIRMWAEQLLVFDAPTIYPIRAMDGGLLSLRLVSGATITPLLDQYGFRPDPPSPAYQQIILGIPTANLAAQARNREFAAPGKDWKPGDPSELFYQPKNPRVDSRWGFSPVEQIIVTLSIASNRQQFLRDYYTSGNVPEGLLPMPENWTMQQIKDFQKWFDAMLAGNLRQRRRMIMVPDTKRDAVMTKEKVLTDGTDDYLNRLVAFAFGESPQPLTKSVGHQSTAKEGNDQAQSVGLEPDLNHVSTCINEIFECFGYDEVEFAFEDEEELDPEKAAKVSDTRLKNGSITINEDREARGEDPRPEPEADMLGIVTPTGWMPIDVEAAAERSERLNPAQSEPDEPKPGAAKLRKGARIKVRAGDLTPRSRQARSDFGQRLRKFLTDQRQRIAKKARSLYATEKAGKGKIFKSTEDDTKRAAAILAMLDWDYQTLYSLALPYFEIAAEEGANAGAHQVTANLGASLPGTLETALPKAKQAATSRAAEMVGLKVEDDGTLAEATAPQWAISTTAKDDVLNAIKQAIKENWTPDQLEAVIEASIVWTPDHADLIADNEIARQQSGGHLISWLASRKVLEYQWTVSDLGCCPLCGEFSMLGPVKAGYEFAPGIFAPSAHPNCRCELKATKYEGEE